jgi:hypothetical protein
MTSNKINNQKKMKNNLRNLALLAVALLSSFTAFAQANNLVVFSQDGDRFTLIVNGLRQNEKPETNVKVTGLIAPNYKVRVIFDNASLAPIDQNIYMMDGGENVTNKEITYMISNTKKGMKLKGQSVADITPQGPAAPGQVIYVFNPSGNATQYTTTTMTTSGTTTTTGSDVIIADPNVGSSTTTVVTPAGGTSTTTTTTTGTTDNANVGMNVGGVGIGINVNINDGMGGTSSSTTTTTTTSSSTTTTGGTTTVNNNPPPASNQCAWPMSDGDFEKAKASVSNQSFKDEQLKVAKQILNTNCMSSAQVKEIMALFSFEDSKLDWAEYAYGKTTDPNNYYQLNDGFTFSDSVDKLNTYIESHKR